MRCEVKNFNDHEILLKTHDSIDFNKFTENTWNGRIFGYFEPWIKGSSTDQQRKHYWALIGDIHDYTGERKGRINLNMKALYMIEKDTDKEPSIARNKMKKEEVAEWLDMIIHYCIDKQIPFQHPVGYVPSDITKYVYKMTMKRMCVACHKYAEIHHATNLIGMGNNRSKHNHLESTFLPLCREHHQLIHNKGLDWFCAEWNVVPIKLSREDLKELGVM
ncbi:putative HNHc nuclease [Facklamia sp. P13064]|uniref:putative HNHc nuclease n=1 Tax=unclassified Facklamia TaxID=2622293 RepID=UPI003D16F7A7